MTLNQTTANIHENNWHYRTVIRLTRNDILPDKSLVTSRRHEDGSQYFYNQTPRRGSQHDRDMPYFKLDVLIYISVEHQLLATVRDSPRVVQLL